MRVAELLLTSYLFTNGSRLPATRLFQQEGLRHDILAPRSPIRP
jgi:hypothetical protein